jgi:hypothetical protein
LSVLKTIKSQENDGQGNGKKSSPDHHSPDNHCPDNSGLWSSTADFRQIGQIMTIRTRQVSTSEIGTGVPSEFILRKHRFSGENRQDLYANQWRLNN